MTAQPPAPDLFKGRHFDREIIVLYVRWYLSFKVIDPKIGPWIRISEQWYENADGWREAVIEAPPQYTKPAWAKYEKYPFVEPFVDFVGQFILERPTNDFKRDYNGYVVTA